MLIASIPVRNDSNLLEIDFRSSDAVELRVDFLHPFNLALIKSLCDAISLPIILTLRTQSQGGNFPDDMEAYKKIILQLASLNPDYLDLESSYLHSIITDIKIKFPKIKIIASRHVVDQTPEDLNILLEEMLHSQVDHYKLVTKANSILDGLRVLEFLAIQAQNYPLNAFCLGELGEPTRILAPVFGGQLHYASIETQQATAPGQLTIQALTDIYDIQHLQPEYQIFALLGDPVAQSIGHLFHNLEFQEKKRRAVYVKLKVAAHELAEVLVRTKRLGFSGFSVTMPLKEAIIPLLDDVDNWSRACQAVNTVIRQNDNWFGMNTDGPAVIDVLKDNTELTNNMVIVLGAGGAAKAIAYGCIHAGLTVTLLNRSLDKAEQIGQSLGCEAKALAALPRLSELQSIILINTLPDKVWHDQALISLIQTCHFQPGTVILDINYYPTPTAFLSACTSSTHVTVLDGMPVFRAQAALQQQIF